MNGWVAPLSDGKRVTVHLLHLLREFRCRVVPAWNQGAECAFLQKREGATARLVRRRQSKEGAMSLGLILIIIVIIYLLGGFSGRFGGYGYGMGHSGMGLGGVILVVLLVLLLLHKI
jgi:Protein of unknown function (DUF3309)